MGIAAQGAIVKGHAWRPMHSENQFLTDSSFSLGTGTREVAKVIETVLELKIDDLSRLDEGYGKLKVCQNST